MLNFLELRKDEVRRIPLLGTSVNRASPEMHQASLAGNILVVLLPFLKRKRGMGKEKRKACPPL
jgi:hypothetical protein